MVLVPDDTEPYYYATMLGAHRILLASTRSVLPVRLNPNNGKISVLGLTGHGFRLPLSDKNCLALLLCLNAPLLKRSSAYSYC